MPRRQFFNAPEQRSVAADVTEAEIFRQRLCFAFRRNGRMPQQRFDFRSENENRAIPGVVERLFAQPVARTEQAVANAIPNGERKHTAKARKTGGAEFFVSMNNRFGITVRTVAAPRLLEFRPQLRMIEDFAVVDELERTRLVRHRLMAAREIDDTETPVSQGYMIVSIKPGVVRAAMRDGIGHSVNQ